MNRKPVIGVSGSIIVDKGGRLPGYKRSYVNDNYIQSVVGAGGVPFIIPFNEDPEVTKLQVEQIDGLILSGGQDVNPLLYGEEPMSKQGPIFRERDEFDQLLIRAAVEAGKPVFAICRGIQILNVAFGGTLYQDVSYSEGSYIQHDQYSGPSYPTHTILIEEDSYLSSIFGLTAVTNSFHHQSIKDVAPGFKVTARTKDNIIEAIEMVDDRFVLGVQWHPEMMTIDHEKMMDLFRLIVNKAKDTNLPSCISTTHEVVGG